MTRFLDEFDFGNEEWIREELQQAWQRISAPQAKQILWEQHLRHQPRLGATLEQCLEKRDIVAAWILHKTPHPSPPLAIIEMGQAAKVLSPKLASQMKAKLPTNLLQPFQVPAGAEL